MPGKIRIPFLNRPGVSTLNNLIVGPVVLPAAIAMIIFVKFAIRDGDKWRAGGPDRPIV